jgi:hypothetical protein
MTPREALADIQAARGIRAVLGNVGAAQMV